MKSNLEFFDLMKDFPEQIVDPYYANSNNVVIIPTQKDEQNQLTQAATDLCRYFDRFETLFEAADKDVVLINQLLHRIDDILMNVPNINYTPFCQYFMVHNLSYSIYTGMREEEKRINVLKDLLISYIRNRHHLYKMHGYSPVILQTMSDNYSHKRKGKIGINKIEKQLADVGITTRLTNIEQDELLDSFYLFPDKGDKELFHTLLAKHHIAFRFGAQKQGKLPDVMIKIKGQYYVLEHKSMKESGGGQDKQMVEVLDFIRYSEENKQVHYITYLDGILSNRFLGHSKAKNEVQYMDIQRILQANPQNYFVNTTTFTLLLKELLSK